MTGVKFVWRMGLKQLSSWGREAAGDCIEGRRKFEGGRMQSGDTPIHQAAFNNHIEVPYSFLMPSDSILSRL